MPAPTPMEEFFFDLRGYCILPKALDAGHLKELNGWADGLPELENGEWLGNMEAHTYGSIDGFNLQNIIEAGEPFERLIDHPAWIDLVRHYLGESGGPFIHECFLNLRGKGGYIGVHSGGWKLGDGRVRSGVDGGRWCIQYMTLIAALDDIGPGDGATVLIPGSHKSAFQHPQQSSGTSITPVPGEEIEGTVEMHLEAGDALLINDMLIHGSGGAQQRGTAPVPGVPLPAGHVPPPLRVRAVAGAAAAADPGTARYRAAPGAAPSSAAELKLLR